jgi:tripartite-type tricarboxylate transporter receptor subunit TctC
MEHIPYKTTPQVVNDLASGVLQIGWSDPATPVPMIEANKIKAIQYVCCLQPRVEQYLQHPAPEQQD